MKLLSVGLMPPLSHNCCLCNQYNDIIRPVWCLCMLSNVKVKIWSQYLVQICLSTSSDAVEKGIKFSFLFRPSLTLISFIYLFFLTTETKHSSQQLWFPLPLSQDHYLWAAVTRPRLQTRVSSRFLIRNNLILFLSTRERSGNGCLSFLLLVSKRTKIESYGSKKTPKRLLGIL